MTDVETAPAAAVGELSRAGRRRVLAVLCLAQISSWGILYYAFPVLSVSITAETGWSAPVITAAFSLGQLATALTGIPVGAVIDRAGPRRVMTAGSVLGALALVAVAAAPNPAVFYLGWSAAGIAMGAVLYPPAFAVKFVPQRPLGRHVHFWFTVTGFDAAPLGRIIKDAPTQPVLDEGRYRAAPAAGRPERREMFTAFTSEGAVADEPGNIRPEFGRYYGDPLYQSSTMGEAGPRFRETGSDGCQVVVNRSR